MTNIDLVLKKAEIQTYDEYYSIRSEKSNLYWTGYTTPPDYEKFFEWYKNRLEDTERDLYLLFAGEECVGSLNIDYYQEFAAIGYSVREAHEGKGYATHLVGQAIKIITLSKMTRKNLAQIKAWINHLNKGSIKVVLRNGFSMTDHSEMRKWFGNEELYLEFAKKI